MSENKLIPYQGTEPFIFVSYSHKDTERIKPILKRLERDGFRIWFDEGILPGSEWDENIAAHAKSCGYFIAFLSEDYLESDNCKDELSYVRDINKERLLVYLDQVELPDGLRMRLNRLQAVPWYKYNDDFEAGIRKLESTKGIEVCRGEAISSDPFKAPENEKKDMSGFTTKGTPQKSNNKKLIALGAAGVLLVLALVIGILAGKNAGKEDVKASDPSEEGLQTVSETSAENETEEAPGDTDEDEAPVREIRVELEPSDDLSPYQFQRSAEIIRGRIGALAQGTSFSVEETEDKIILVFSSEILHQYKVKTLLRAFISRPIEIYLADASDRENAVKLERKELESVTIRDASEAKAVGLQDGYPFIEVKLTEEGAEKAAAIAGAEEYILIQDMELFSSNYISADVVLAEDGKSFYFQGDDEDDPFLAAMVYNWSHDALDSAFSFTIEDDVDLWAKWETVEKTENPGKYQVNAEDITEPCVSVAFSVYSSKTVSSGNWIDLQESWKAKLDAIGLPYAFGVYNDYNIVIKTSTDRMSRGMIEMLGSKTGKNYLVLLNNWKLSQDLEEIKFVSDEQGALSLSCSSGTYSKTMLEKLSTSLLEEKEQVTIKLLDYSGKELASGVITEPITDGSLVFTQKCYGDSGAFTENDRWLADFLTALSAADSQLPKYSYETYKLQPEDASFGMDYPGRRSFLEGIIQALNNRYPSIEIYISEQLDALSLFLNLEPDDSMVETAVSMAKEIVKAYDWEAMEVDLSFYLLEENDAESERGRIFVKYEPISYYGEYSKDETGVKCYGVFGGGRLKPYAEEFLKAVTTDDLFSELADEEDWSIDK